MYTVPRKQFVPQKAVVRIHFKCSRRFRAVGHRPDMQVHHANNRFRMLAILVDKHFQRNNRIRLHFGFRIRRQARNANADNFRFRIQIMQRLHGHSRGIIGAVENAALAAGDIFLRDGAVGNGEVLINQALGVHFLQLQQRFTHFRQRVAERQLAVHIYPNITISAKSIHETLKTTIIYAGAIGKHHADRILAAKLGFLESACNRNRFIDRGRHFKVKLLEPVAANKQQRIADIIVTGNRQTVQLTAVSHVGKQIVVAIALIFLARFICKQFRAVIDQTGFHQLLIHFVADHTGIRQVAAGNRRTPFGGIVIG